MVPLDWDCLSVEQGDTFLKAHLILYCNGYSEIFSILSIYKKNRKVVWNSLSINGK